MVPFFLANELSVDLAGIVNRVLFLDSSPYALFTSCRSQMVLRKSPSGMVRWSMTGDPSLVDERIERAPTEGALSLVPNRKLRAEHGSGSGFFFR